ncbi:efflux RND transporter permease subunit [Aliikangiella coralliicola]|uniref:Efflux RND transporter permease subunit n=1 Tax=Aliikangiella coralliicola TaxID=2592383 RepID=A0A545UJ77_9GAMM|nr:efflux RND transporter permease subunit [Aliikangiella coralliicola]TQV89493.1 efflux RND transporter permease subunit [Aliikangiella coralliicola]
MHFLTGWFIRNPVAANLLMGLILFLGVITAMTIRIEGFPRVPPESISINTTYLNASTAQVDELVTQKIEKALEGLQGVRSITSQSNNDFSSVVVRRAGGQDLQKLLDKVRLRIDGVSDLPSSVQRPIIQDGGFDFPALYLNLHGHTDPATLQKLAERLREELLSQPELSRMNIWGLHEREMKIEVEPQILRRFNLTVADVVTQIRASSLNFQAGTLKTTGGFIYLRADNRAKFSTEYARIPIIERPDGTSVLLGEIASVKDTFKEGDYLFRFNGEPTTGMEVLIGQKENLLRVSEVVHEVVASFESQLPPNVKVTIWGNSANYIADRLQLLSNNGIQGLLLVILVLSMFLNVRLAFWVAMGIPISIMGALAVAGSNWVDYSLNDVTTFGLIIVLGILVDDAVVVGESVFEERRTNPDPILGTEAGTHKVAVATVFGVLTTIAAFFPMLLLDNPLGKVLAGFSGIVIFALIFSLIESKFILPAHLAHTKFEQRPRFLISRFWEKVQRASQNGLKWFRNNIYAPLLKSAIHHRYATLVLFIAAGTLGLGLIGQGKIKTVFFPDVPGQIITVNLEMDARAPFQLTQANVERIRSIGIKLNEEIKQNKSLDKSPIHSMFLQISDASSAQIYAELTPTADRPDVGILDIVKQWRERTGQVEGATQLQFVGSEELAGGFQLQLFSKDLELLELASKDLRAFLGKIEGVNNIRDTLTTGQPQLEVRVKPEARNLGFDTETLAAQIGNSFGGAEVQKIRRAGTELRVLVQNADLARDTIEDLLQTQLRSKSGKWIPLQSVAEIKSGYVSGTMHRQNGKLVNTLAASIDRATVAPEEIGQAVYQQFVPDLATKYPSVKVKLAGELEEIGEIQGGMKKALLLAAVLIYVLMAVPLKSYWQPFVILAIVPFGFVGAALGHLIMDLPLSVLSFFGMLALTGVVINDSLVLLTRYNQAREEGLSVSAALQEAGVGRFQAIFLTTATTVIGLLPLLTETSEQAQYLIPAAVSLAFGELFSTALMLLLVPVLIAITEDVKTFFRNTIWETKVNVEG